MSGEIKQVIVLRTDLDMGKGKLVAQGAHASLMSYFLVEKMDKKVSKNWIDGGEKKVVLRADSFEMLNDLYKATKRKKIPCALVSDAGLTQLPPGSSTALGIGPWDEDEIDIVTGDLKLL